MSDVAEPDYRKVMQQREAEKERSANRGSWWMAIIFIALIGGCSALLSSSGDDDEPSTDGLRVDARRVCHELIDDRLKAPSTSDFEERLDATITAVGDVYTVRGTVDSENSFGGNVRSSYTCEVRSTGDTWRLVNLTGLN